MYSTRTEVSLISISRYNIIRAKQLYCSSYLSNIINCYDHILWLLNHPSDFCGAASEEINIPLIANCFVCVPLLGTMPGRCQNRITNGMTVIAVQKSEYLRGKEDGLPKGLWLMFGNITMVRKVIHCCEYDGFLKLGHLCSRNV